jgi:hypothetical protein
MKKTQLFGMTLIIGSFIISSCSRDTSLINTLDSNEIEFYEKCSSILKQNNSTKQEINGSKKGIVNNKSVILFDEDNSLTLVVGSEEQLKVSVNDKEAKFEIDEASETIHLDNINYTTTPKCRVIGQELFSMLVFCGPITRLVDGNKSITICARENYSYCGMIAID